MDSRPLLPDPSQAKEEDGSPGKANTYNGIKRMDGSWDDPRDLGTLLGSVLSPKKKKEEGSGSTPWRVLFHQPFLMALTADEGHGWGRRPRSSCP